MTTAPFVASNTGDSAPGWSGRSVPSMSPVSASTCVLAGRPTRSKRCPAPAVPTSSEPPRTDTRGSATLVWMISAPFSRRVKLPPTLTMLSLIRTKSPAAVTLLLLSQRSGSVLEAVTV